MQKTQLIGHLGQDSEVKDLGNNQVINFSVAVTDTWVDKQGNKQSKTTWYEVAKWGNNVAVAQYLKKGTQVFVEGKPEARAFLNKQGEAVAVNGINCQSLILLGGKN